MNNNNTIIENVEYLDMDDIKNSWYFDAEKFDVNFPLVRSYKGGVDQCHVRGLLSDWYEYWDAVFSYYRNVPDMAGVCYVASTLSPPHPDPASDLNEHYYIDSRFQSRIMDHFDYEFLFQTKQLLLDGRKITYFLAGMRDAGGVVSLGERFYLKSGYYSSFGRSPLHPHSQLMISRDWDLLKRYFFFMIRNHQYKGSKFMYTVDRSSGSVQQYRFVDLSDTLFSELPKDYRFNSKEFNDGGSAERIEDKVLTVGQKNKF